MGTQTRGSAEGTWEGKPENRPLSTRRLWFAERTWKSRCPRTWVSSRPSRTKPSHPCEPTPRRAKPGPGRARARGSWAAGSFSIARSERLRCPGTGPGGAHDAPKRRRPPRPAFRPADTRPGPPPPAPVGGQHPPATRWARPRASLQHAPRDHSESAADTELIGQRLA